MSMFTCKHNLRPRVKGRPILIEAGTPFDEAMIDDHTLAVFIERGEASAVKASADVINVDAVEVPEVSEEPSEEDQMQLIKDAALEKFGVELKNRKLSTLQEAYEKLEKEHSSYPTGIFNLDVADLADKELDDLDAIHAEICANNDLDAPDPFESVEQAIEKLTSQA